MTRPIFSRAPTPRVWPSTPARVAVRPTQIGDCHSVLLHWCCCCCWRWRLVRRVAEVCSGCSWPVRPVGLRRGCYGAAWWSIQRVEGTHVACQQSAPEWPEYDGPKGCAASFGCASGANVVQQPHGPSSVPGRCKVTQAVEPVAAIDACSR